MTQLTLLHSPTLESVLMVEKLIKKYSQEYTKYQLWKNLPRKMMYQTFQYILEYLKESNKIMIDKEGVLVWIYNPELMLKFLKRNPKFY